MKKKTLEIKKRGITIRIHKIPLKSHNKSLSPLNGVCVCSCRLCILFKSVWGLKFLPIG
jgi:hypothetical protein